MADNNNGNDWKWGQSSKNAFNLVGGFFGFNPEDARRLNDSTVSAALKKADESEVQVKRVQDWSNALKKHWKNSIKANAMVHGLVRTGLSLMGQQQQQESQTTKEYAKAVTNTRVLSAKTSTAVEKTYKKGEKQIQKSGSDLQRFQGELDAQFQISESAANQQSRLRQTSFRERAQKRLEANARPWRNY